MKLRILGIDPGSVVTGFGLIEVEGQQLRVVDYGVVRARAEDHCSRLEEIYSGIGAVCAKGAPDEIAIESVFVSRNAASALKLGQARAAALCATFASGGSIHEYAPRQIKQSVVGTGGAEKGQVQLMMRTLLRLEQSPPADAADALAVAVCHANRRGTARLLQQAVGR